jgi:membrane fusion protein (multidrug efflux system)
MATTETERQAPEARVENQAQPEPQKASFHERRRSAMKNPRVRAFMAMAAVVLVLAGIAAWRYFTSYEWTDDAQIDGHLSSVSARVSGHVIRLNVRDNQRVEAGQVLVEIDPADYQIAVERAKADYADAIANGEAAQVNVPITSVDTSGQISAAQADVNNSRAAITAATQQYQAAKAQLAEAQANNTKAQSDLARYKLLVDKQEISQQQYDQALAAAQSSAASVQAAEANVSAAEQQIVQAKGKLDQAEAKLRSANTGPRQVAMIRAKAAAAEAEVQRKKAELDQAQLNLQYTKVVAPVAGVVSNRTVEVGQNVQAGQELMTVIPLEDIWVTANFKETQLRHMHPGQPVTIAVDANDKTYQGKVDSIAGASGSLFSLLPPENATGNYVKVVQRIPVKIVFDPGELKGHELRPGMSVEPKVWIRK